MEFEWDEEKSATNDAERGIPFEYAALVFLDHDRLEWLDQRRDYGEERRITVGLTEPGIMLTVVYTMRAGLTRIISARAASRRERASYDNGPKVIG